MNEAFELANANNDDTESSDSDADDDSDESDNDDEDDTNSDEYTVSTGNAGFVLVNQMIDYIHRGDDLTNMCLYEYCAKVYKSIIKDGDIEKNEKALKAQENKNKKKYNFEKKKKRGPLPQPKYFYSSEHPQSKTHWQTLRTDNQKLVPALSKLPPSKNSSKMKYQKCMLLLFKPF